jgi:hypothetical protein
MKRQPFVAVLRDMVVAGPGFRCGIDMDRGIGEVLQVVEKLVPVLFCNRVPAFYREA